MCVVFGVRCSGCTQYARLRGRTKANEQLRRQRSNRTYVRACVRVYAYVIVYAIASVLVLAIVCFRVYAACTFHLMINKCLVYAFHIEKLIET